MLNTTDKIGERIKLERLRKNMTQAELAGDTVTRNMLCLIERDNALPSLETLCYIANTLEIPAGMLFAEDERQEAFYTKIQTVVKAKKLYSDEKYEECADVCRTEYFDDELIMLAAECELKIAEKSMKSFTLKSASEHLDTAHALSKKTIYFSKDFEGTIKSYQFFIKCALSSINRDEVGRFSKIPSRIPAGEFIFLSILSLLDSGKADEAEAIAASYPFMTAYEASYFKAYMLMRAMKTEKADEILKKLYQNEDLNFILKYRVCAALETCAEIKRDFESAYSYSKEKQKMTELFSK